MTTADHAAAIREALNDGRSCIQGEFLAGPKEHASYAKECEEVDAHLAALLAELEAAREREAKLTEALAHAQTTVGLATTFIPAARFEEFVNRRAALAAGGRAAGDSEVEANLADEARRNAFPGGTA